MKSRIQRREFLRVGLSGFTALSLPGLFRLRAQAPQPTKHEHTSVILVWLRGGPSHLETFDPKPEAPSEYRGIFGSIRTNVPGVHLCDLLPRHAKIADKFTLLRSMSHTGGGHPAGSLQMLSGDTDAQDKEKPIRPDWMTVANFLRAEQSRPTGLPNYIGVNPVVRYDNFTIAGSGYLNPAYGPFMVTGDPNDLHFEVPNLSLKGSVSSERISERVRLKQSLDHLARTMDNAGTMQAMDRFEVQALNLLTSPTAREAFDLAREPNHVRERYGRHQWGQQCLMARRLVEAGVEIVTTTLDGPLCGRVANWDDHAVNHNVFDALQFRAPYFDQAVSALIEDIYARGLDKRVLVVVTGEFGRTPRIERVASSGGGVASAQAGVVQPGRDHWPRAFSNLWAGGGIQTGGVIGSTDKRGEEVIDRLCKPGDFLATIYRHLGIDTTQTLTDFSGRPNLIVSTGAAIPELIG